MKYFVKNVLQEGRDILIKYGIDPREARLLLAYSMQISTSLLFINEECTEKQYEGFLSFINRRINGEPYAYIIGHKEFMKLDFIVNSNVLIPRDDTEILVQEAIKLAKTKTRIKVVDVCTGSGCIAVSIAKYVDSSIVDAIDISDDALKIAMQNAKLNNVSINFINSNLFENVKGKYNMIISNPPYIPSNEIDSLQIEVKKEPRLALDGGTDGLDFYGRIIEEAPNYLESDGALLLEIGYDQGKKVYKLLEDNGYTRIEIIKDLGNNDRVVVAYFSN